MNKPIKRILIANRGEIACRIIKTVRATGREAIAVYSDIDKDSLHTIMADQAYPLGGSESSISYLNIKKIIDIAKSAKVDAIHPGYGFLSENIDFVDKLNKTKIKLIGPSSHSMKLLGDKIAAKKIASRLKIPVIEGVSIDPNLTEKQILNQLKSIEFPIIVKAAGGGGGRGMRIVRSKRDLIPSLESAKRESLSFFGNDNLFIERYIEGARHIEVQIVGDLQGHITHLFERDCTYQRNHQKIIEEAPASGLTEKITQLLRANSIKLAKFAKYYNLGTVEFLVLPKQEKIYFLEVNTRLQVEHPVTEAVTGLDLVKLQIDITEGKKLKDILSKKIEANGHAIECRICAEDPVNNFQPQSGVINLLKFGTTDKVSNLQRIDTGFRENDTVSHYYDSLLAKLIVKTDNRKETINKLVKILSTTKITGIRSNHSYLLELLKDDAFQNLKHHTKSAEVLAKQLSNNPLNNTIICGLALIHEILDCPQQLSNLNIHDIWNDKTSFRIQGSNPLTRTYSIHGNEPITVKVLPISKQIFTVSILNLNSNFSKKDSIEIEITKKFAQELHYKIHEITYSSDFIRSTDYNWITCHLGSFQIASYSKIIRDLKDNNINYPPIISSPLPGKILELNVKHGDQIPEGHDIAVIESMKMEHRLKAPKSAEVVDIMVRAGESISAREPIVRLEYK